LIYIGIDAYFPLSDATTPSVAALNEAWHIIKIENFKRKRTRKYSLQSLLPQLRSGGKRAVDGK
jgi:hypothetical protein